MKNIYALCLALVFLTLSFIGQTFAADDDADFFRLIEGKWSGPGEVVAGKYKGSKFICNFAGISQLENAGLILDGNCRLGVFSQPMKATVTKHTTGFRGAFNDGAKGDGVDIVSGKIGNDHMVFGLNRNKLNGAMLARLEDQNSMNITVSVKINDDLVPVLGLKLKRSGDVARDVAKK
ncbi:hypothetical protein [Bartonella tamiae]|uniref:Uncharacterized protein n=1 Tax=Bartonella tamiae Th239 TaxID=1094558 RepID=J0ZKA9_9HYPH|nr:hypothetical protein [Bartonella tamiae]EJF88788.1 hypothetical protein ME5_01339 [Bartonella tamiae Th239]EJF94962.1 hypothetical protein MEG_00543 [Bartonella tamiae Th307]